MPFVPAPISATFNSRRALPKVCSQRWSIKASTSTPVQSTPMVLEMADDTRISFNFGAEPVKRLALEINDLLHTFNDIAASANDGKKLVGESLSYVHEEKNLRVTIDCNPNIYTDAFNAQAYVVVEDENMRVSSSAKLTKVIDSVKTFKASLNPQA